MFRFVLVVALVFVLVQAWPTIKQQLHHIKYDDTVHSVEKNLNELKNETQEVQAAMKPVYDEIQQFILQLGEKNQLKNPSNSNDKVALNAPKKDTFSVYNIELGDAKEDIEHDLGKAKRISLNEYGVNWHTYHEDYHHFFMTMYNQNNKVIGLYTNQDLISSRNGIRMGVTKEKVREKLGTPLKSIQKGFVIYQVQKNSDYDLFLLHDAYVTIFYDKHENNSVTAIQIIDKKTEQKKKDMYAKGSSSLEKGFEYQLFDLTNATRVNHNLTTLTWDQHVRITARDHSVDMAKNDYFDHTNLKGQSPFDRMNQDHIRFLLAGENIAYGQFSSIFAHEGLMNSLGHRENILQKDFRYLGVGVAFNKESQPFFTQNFYAK